VSYLEDIDSLSVNNGTAWTTDRTIQVFAGTAARGSAIPTPVEGMYAHLNDTDALTYYNGSAWANAGASGLTLINTSSFSAVSSHSVNDVFSSTYDNYKILLTNYSFTGAAGVIQMRLRVGGTDNTSNEYQRSKFFWAYTNATGSDSGSIGTSSFLIGETSTDYFADIELGGPFRTQETKHATQATRKDNGLLYAGSMTVTTSYTGFTLLTTSTTMTGSVSVYGYNK